MTDLQLHYFTMIVELGSFSETALELHISQSSISKQIRQLEDEIGVQLFDRSQRKVRLTAAGEALYMEAKAVLEKISELKDTAHQLSTANTNRILLLAIPVISHYNFYIPLQIFEVSHKQVHIDLEEIEEPDMNKRIRKGEYDAAITYYNPQQEVENARFYPLLEDEMVLVCHKEHPLSRETVIQPRMLDGLSVYAMQKYTCTSLLYDLYFQKHHCKPNIIFRGRPGTILAGSEAGRAPALLSRIHTETLKLANVNLIPFSPSLKGSLGIIVNEHSRNKRLILDMLDVLKNSK